MDFERQTLREGLEQAGFAFGDQAVFSWLGVTMYLTLDAIHATLATMAQRRAGTGVVLTYNQPPDVLTSDDAQITAAMAGLAANMGEPFISRFRFAEMARLLHQAGFSQITDFGPGRGAGRLFRRTP